MFDTFSLHVLAPRQARLFVTVAERTGSVVHQITESLVVRDEAKRDHVVEGHVRAGWRVAEGRGAVDGIHPIRAVQHLPDLPRAVDHAVVQEEERVGRAAVEVLHGAADVPVAAAVDAELVVRAAVALHLLLEVLDEGLVEDQAGEVVVGVVALGEPGVQVADQAAWVVLEGAVAAVLVWQVERAEINSVL